MRIEALKSEVVFTFHLIITAGAWVAPFLLNWKILVPILAGVLLQFAIFGRCLMNEHHETKEEDHATFYSQLLERMGFQPNRKALKIFIRRILYPILAVVSVVWQEGLGHAPLLF